jgi:putative transcription factor
MLILFKAIDMGTCEVCGTNTLRLFRASIEGISMNVCEGCSSYGHVLYVPESKPKAKEVLVSKAPEIEERIVNNFSEIIKKSREKINLNQEEFALKLNVRLSLIRALENKEQLPDLKLAEKLEKELNVTLIEEVSDEAPVNSGSLSKEVTLGDMIKIKKRKA